MSCAWIEPKKLAQSVFNKLTSIEKRKVKANLSNYGSSIFKNFNYNESEIKEFIEEMSVLLGDT